MCVYLQVHTDYSCSWQALAFKLKCSTCLCCGQYSCSNQQQGPCTQQNMHVTRNSRGCQPRQLRLAIEGRSAAVVITSCNRMLAACVLITPCVVQLRKGHHHGFEPHCRKSLAGHSCGSSTVLLAVLAALVLLLLCWCCLCCCDGCFNARPTAHVP
jgi:hypothetical protein